MLKAVDEDDDEDDAARVHNLWKDPNGTLQPPREIPYLTVCKAPPQVVHHRLLFKHRPGESAREAKTLALWRAGRLPAGRFHPAAGSEPENSSKHQREDADKMSLLQRVMRLMALSSTSSVSNGVRLHCSTKGFKGGLTNSKLGSSWGSSVQDSVVGLLTGSSWSASDRCAAVPNSPFGWGWFLTGKWPGSIDVASMVRAVHKDVNTSCFSASFLCSF